MKKYFNISLLALSTALILPSCDKEDTDEDNVKPEIVSVTINNKTQDIVANTNSQISFDASLSDNEALGSFKIDIHDIFDDHSHGKRNGINWAETKIIDLSSGKQETINTTMSVPTDAIAGPYHAVFRLLDVEGNEGEFKEIDFMVSNGSEPEISILTPDLSNEVDISKGSTLSITGTITDDVDLDEIQISLSEEGDDHDHNKKQEEPLYENDFDLTGSSDLVWDFQTDGNLNISIPTDAEEGVYSFKVTAKDSEGNIAIFEGDFHIM